MQKRVAKVIIQNDKDEILLVYRGRSAPGRPSTWDLPGGVVENDESPEDAGLREVKEETTIALPAIKQVLAKTMLWGNGWTYFYARHTPDKIVLSWEHDKYIWCLPTQLTELNELPDFYAKDINMILKSLKT